MLYKYCPDCASLDLQKITNSKDYKCLNCNYIGEIKEDTIDKINVFRKIIKSDNQKEINNSYFKKDFENQSNTYVPLKEKLNNKLTKKSSDWELL
jgi:DNA-directed RNA polymerase subunit M/transcription elongation factor TFIIS